MDKTARDLIGRTLRIAHEVRPKGGIPDRIWQLLLAIERKQGAASGRSINRAA